MSNREVIAEMRDWLIDCFDNAEIVETLDDSEVIAAVDRHYIGGKLAFLAECEWVAA